MTQSSKLFLAPLFGVAMSLSFCGIALADNPMLKLLQDDATRNQGMLALLKKDNLNCCDARYQPACETLMKPTSADQGLGVTDVKWSDGVAGNFLPLEIRKVDEKTYSVKGQLWGFNDFPTQTERKVKLTDTGLVWITGKGEELAITELKPKTLNDSTSTRPFNSGGGPAVCYIQRGLPDLKALAESANKADYWCYYDEGDDAPLKPNQKFRVLHDVCLYPVTCRRPEAFSQEVKSKAGCLPIKGVCPPATYCALDPAVKVENDKIISVSPAKKPEELPPAKLEAPAKAQGGE